MKASELMIGDWVLTLESTHKEKVYAQIWAIEEGQTSILVKKDNCNWFVDIEWIEPIPLTPEILEKNGFSKSRLMGEQRHFTYYLAPSVSLLAIYDADFSLKIGDCARYIKYVHKLQHALSLCGIEKEITI